jgi:hypothetical protein
MISMHVRGTRRIGACAVVAALLMPGLMSASAADPSASQLATTTLAPSDGLTPQDFGSAALDALEYADPTEALSIIDAPVPNNDGSVELSYPLGLPPGHGITPELTLQYGSGGGNGWLGTGWDLGVGEITIDTTFGAPHFSAASESESYLLDGDLLVPNANDDAWEPRVVGDRSDFTRQVDNDFDEIIRHQVVVQGKPVWPADYFWEVRSKDGSVKWYGGTPDSGGPVPTGTAPTIDERAVVRNEAGHIVTWLLSAQRDIGVNLIRYEYEKVTYGHNGTAWFAADGCVASTQLCGQHTYLDRILYTDATSVIADRNGAPYEIDFVRESEPVPGRASTPRLDPIVDASLGYVDVVSDRLGRVEVKWGKAPDSGTARTYDTIAARYDFTYGVGRFGKSLLTTVIQGVDDLHTHVIEYFDELTDTADGVNGFGTPQPDGTATGEDWDTKADTADVTFLDTTADVSALGGSETNGGSGNIYVGFNAITPSKTLSFGVGLELSGSDTEAIAEWIDLNGDGLPDKVFFENGEVKFRINQTGPGGSGAWTQKDDVKVTDNAGTTSDLDTLSRNSNFGFQVSIEAYPLFAIGLGTGLGFSWTNTYFSDVNGDGLVDFVNGGRVYFNTLNASGIPTFRPSSDRTPIPLDPSPLPTISSAELTKLSEQLSTQSPPIDTVRRFIAPFSGKVSIAAPVTLPVAGADGVRVAVQHNGTEVSDAILDAAGESAFADPIVRDVEAGDRIYFRVGAIDDGVDDAVTWAPVITYQNPAWPELDANGLSQHAYSATADFTLAGRPNDFIAMPETGTVSVAASVTLTAPLTDDVRVVVVKRSPDNTDADDLEQESVTVLGTIVAGTAAGGHTFVQPIDVALKEQVDPADSTKTTVLAEKLSVYLSTDSPVDLADIEFSSTITYTSWDAVDSKGEPIPVIGKDGKPSFEHHVRPHVEIYGYSDLTAGAKPSSLAGDNDVVITVEAGSDAPDALTTVGAVITVKSAAGLVKKSPLTLAVDGSTATTTSPVDLDGVPANSWIEIMIRDNTFARDGLTLERFATVAGGGRDVGRGRRPPLVRYAGDLPAAVPWVGHRGLHRRRQPRLAEDGGVGVRDHSVGVPDRHPDAAAGGCLARRGQHRTVVCLHLGTGRARRRDVRRTGCDRPVGGSARQPLRRCHDPADLAPRSRQRRLLEHHGAVGSRRPLCADTPRDQRARSDAELRHRPARCVGRHLAQLRAHRLRGPQRRRLSRRHLDRFRHVHRPARRIPAVSRRRAYVGDEPGSHVLGERRALGRHGRHPAEHQGQHERGRRRRGREGIVGQ